jgi:hypothetical protein
MNSVATRKKPIKTRKVNHDDRAELKKENLNLYTNSPELQLKLKDKHAYILIFLAEKKTTLSLHSLKCKFLFFTSTTKKQQLFSAQKAALQLNKWIYKMFFSFLCTLCLFSLQCSPPFNVQSTLCVTEKKKRKMHTSNQTSPYMCVRRLSFFWDSFSKKNRKIHSQDNSSATKIFQGTRTITGINMGEKVAQVNIETLNVVYLLIPPLPNNWKLKENPKKPTNRPSGYN